MKLRHALRTFFFFFFTRKFENWNFLLSSGQADKVELTCKLEVLFTHSDLYKWTAQLVLGASLRSQWEIHSEAEGTACAAE